MPERGVLGMAMVLAVGAFLGGLLVGWHTDPSRGSTAVQQTTTATDTATPRERPTRAERLMARYACWTGATPPASPDPTHAVVTLPGERAELVDAATGYAIWLDGAPGVLHGFCP